MALGSKEILPGSIGDLERRGPIVPQRMPPTPVSWALVGASVIVFLAGGALPDVAARGVLHGPLVFRGEWWRVFTFLVTHGGALHLLFNLSAVWTLGRVLESGLGSVRFLLASVIGGVGSAALILLVNFETRTVGLSGMILCWLGVLLPIAKPSARRQLLLWLMQIAVISLLPGVSWAGHLGGLLSGLPLGISLRFGPKAFSRAVPVVAFVVAALAYLAGARLLP